MPQLISIVLPVYNQADHVRQIVEEYEAALHRLKTPHEIILVPNGCTDRSADICSELVTQHVNVRVESTPNRGWGHAVRTGLQTARGDLLCYTNSARTSPQDLVLILLYAEVYPSVVVKANRKIRESTRRRLGSLIYNLECRWLFDLSYWDINGTPKVFPREFAKLLDLTRTDDLIDAEFNVVCRRENYPVIEVPVFSTRRHGGKSTTNLRSAFNMYWGAYDLWRSWDATHK